MTSKKLKESLEPIEVFEEVPVDQYMENKIEQFPQALPEDISLEHYQKLLNDSRFFGEQGMTVQQPRSMVDILGDKRKALKGINEDMPKKKAYPNYDEFMSYPSPKDAHKWVNAVKDMYYRVHKGVSKSIALQNVIAGWDEMEQRDFKNWLRYYEENTHKKYSESSTKPGVQIKVGQIGYWEDINRAGYFVPVHRDPPAQNVQPAHINEIDLAKDPATNEGVQSDEKREIIEAQRNKIVSRLDSAEKLLRSHEGQIFAGKEFEALMHIIYELKKKIHTVNKISTATKLYEDMIVREANILTKKGFTRASEVLFKIAAGDLPPPAPPANPTTGAGNPGTVPGDAPGQSPPPSNPPTGDVPPEGMVEFLDGLEGDKDRAQSNDLEVHEADDSLTVEAQAVSEPTPTPAAPEENLEVEEPAPEAAPEGGAGVQTSTFDQKADQLFQNLKVEDVVQKLEDTTKYYKNREMPRQLAWIDMMLDHLGLAPFFPSLAEATNNALASNQYVLTRLEEITSRLRGTVQTNEIDLKGQNPVVSSPELESARKKLQQDADNEKNRKQMKKEQENSQLAGAGKPEPELEVEEDLGGPVTTPAAPVPVAAPAPAPTPVR